MVRERFLPNMVVYNAIVSAEQGGISGRPDTKIPETENLYVVGDWIGPEGLLADASFASAKLVCTTNFESTAKAHFLCINILRMTL